MIKLKNLFFETLLVGKKLTIDEQNQLAGDIQNWLLYHKSVNCNVEVK